MSCRPEHTNMSCPGGKSTKIQDIMSTSACMLFENKHENDGSSSQFSWGSLWRNKHKDATSHTVPTHTTWN